MKEKVKKDHHADADEAGDDAALDLIEPSLFGRSAPPLLYFLGETDIRHPALAPIGLIFGGAGHHPFASAVQIRAALAAEFEIIAGLNAASRTKHNQSSFKLRQSVSRRIGTRVASGKCAVGSSVTLAPLDSVMSA